MPSQSNRFETLRVLMKNLTKVSRVPEKFNLLHDQMLHESKWRQHFTRKLDALLRVQYADALLTDKYPYALLARRFKILSQNEEDGMTLALLREAGVRTRTFVDIGCGRNGGNSGLLAAEFGWSGMMLDSSAQAIEVCRKRYAFNQDVRFVTTFVTPETIDRILIENGCDGEIDLFSLDIDSYDYWVLEAMSACSPRVMILEYNGAFGPTASVTVPRDARLGVLKGYHGASLTALTRLAAAKGYRLLACDDSGTNAFYLRNDLRPEIPATPVAVAFRPMKDRYDPMGETLRAPLDVFAEAAKLDLPLHEVGDETAAVAVQRLA